MSIGVPGTPDGPPGSDPFELGTDALNDRRELAEKVIRASRDAVTVLHDIVNDEEAEIKERRMAAQALLGLSGVSTLAGRSGGGPGAGTDPMSGLWGLLDARPKSRWAASAVGRQRCPDPTCDWPQHRGGEAAHGHTVDAGYQDGCGYRHSMMDPCGPVPDGGSTRSRFWENQSV